MKPLKPRFLIHSFVQLENQNDLAEMADENGVTVFQIGHFLTTLTTSLPVR